MLRFKGCQSFRQRLLLSTLTGRAVRIDDIRVSDPNPGLRDFEASFLRLLEKLTNGCVVEISETGTALRYRPGVIVCGPGVVHDCGTSRSMGWFMEPLVVLALFAKRPLSITMKGVTNDQLDPSVDVMRTVTLPLLKRLGVEDSGMELKVVKRGAKPLGGGELVLRMPIVKQLAHISMTDEGMVKRIRGVAYSMKVSPQNTNRMVDGARGVLNQLLADVYVFTDALSGSSSGLSPGFGLTLVAETTSGCLISAEAAASAGGRAAGGEQGAGLEALQEPLVVPEDVGRLAAQALLEEVQRGGVVDGSHQPLILTLAALGPEEMHEVRLGPLTTQAVRTLRLLRDFAGVTFNIRTERDSQTVFLSCIGAGLKNLARKTT
ncbi:RNA 3'-terminal phosphate cyclase domain-containing protein [Haematococcus lacustris]